MSEKVSLSKGIQEFSSKCAVGTHALQPITVVMDMCLLEFLKCAEGVTLPGEKLETVGDI